MIQVHSDVAIIGGSFAGLSAALQLSRGRRRVTLFDTGTTRHRFAAAAYGFLGQDGQSPDCHGFENADRPTAVLMHPATLRHARFLTEWTRDIPFLTNGQNLDDTARAGFISDGYQVIDSRVLAFTGTGGQLTGVQVQDGRSLPRSILYLTPHSRLSTDLAVQLGCAMTQGPFGSYVQTDAQQRTTVPGVFAAGDMTRPMYGSVFAAADGVRAAVACHQTLVWGPGFLDAH